MKKTVKDFVTKLSSTMSTVKAKGAAAVMAMATTFECGVVAAYANGGMIGGGADQQGTNLVKKILNIIVDIIPWVGAFFIVFGAVKAFLAWRNDGNPDAITTAAKDIVIGLVMVLFGTLVWDPIANLIFG